MVGNCNGNYQKYFLISGGLEMQNHQELKGKNIHFLEPVLFTCEIYEE